MISQFIAKVIRAQDPLGLWASVRSVSVPIKVYGPFFYLVGQGDVFNQAGEAEIFTKETRVVFTNFPRPGFMGIYTGDKVEVRDSGGVMVEERLSPRQNFRPGFFLPKWDHLDVLYFLGYAIWNYVNFPFDLSSPGIKTELLKQISIEGKPYDRLRVTYPSGFHTHSSEQLYYFGENGILFRHEYTVEIIGPWLKGRHYTLEWARTEDGFAWAARRRVEGRIFGIPWGIAKYFLPLILLDPKWFTADKKYGIFGDIDWLRLNRE